MDVIVFILAGLIGGLGLGYIVFIAARKGQLEKEKSKVLRQAIGKGKINEREL